MLSLLAAAGGMFAGAARLGEGARGAGAALGDVAFITATCLAAADNFLVSAAVERTEEFPKPDDVAVSVVVTLTDVLIGALIIVAVSVRASVFTSLL